MKQYRSLLSLVCAAVCAGAVHTGAAHAEAYSGRADVVAFANEMSESHGFDADALLATLAGAEYKQSIIDAISRPAEKRLTWGEYRKIFLTESRIEGGRKFLHEHARTLGRAEREFGVPAHVIVAVLGVETLYGRRKGSYRVLDALTTLGFDYPPRSRFFRKELKEFLLLTREENLVPDALVGSYAGAMGYGQFIPSSYRAYAVDFSGDGVKDIWDNPVDAIGSIAAYLSRHGWRRGESITMPVNKPASDAADLLNVALKPYTTVAAVRAQGVRVNGVEDDADATLMHLAGADGDEYWLGLHNFYVITRYNHSRLYAMAVYQLGEALVEDLRS